MRIVKYTITGFIVLAAAASAAAQDMYDALRYSDYNYYGTARTIGMGNAVTALGGDLGSIGINPAGSAVNSYSQFTITPSLSMYGIKATYNPAPGIGGENESMMINTNRTRLKLPNFGLVLQWDDKKSDGLKRITLGIVGNATANYSTSVLGRCINAESSYMGEISQFLSDGGYTYNEMTSHSAYDSGIAWRDIVAARTGMVSTFGGSNNNWIGATEREFPDGSIGTAGLLEQQWDRVTSGYKYDLVMNVGLNFSDQLFLGFNLGGVALKYTSDTYMREYALNPDDFVIDFDDGTTCFDNARLNSWYSAEGYGVYGKLGVIYVPIPEFRIGAAIQTPTITAIKENWENYGDITFTDRKYSRSELSPEGEYEYDLISPFRFNVGAAYNFGQGVLSADYEYANYSQMRFREKGNESDRAFRSVNSDIKNYMGPQHSFRIGAEFKPVPSVAVRAGYGLTTSAQYSNDRGVKKALDATRQYFSLGLGYSSEGSFFCDLALRGTFYPKEYVYPYDNYIAGIDSPEIELKQKLVDVVFTFGWRF